MTNEELGQLLSNIADENDGMLLPRTVVETARPFNHPLHHRFEWDDSIAAQKHREDQARQLIRLAKVSITTPNRVRVEAPMFLRDVRSPPSQQGYIEVARIATDEELARETIIREFHRVIDALARAHKVAAVLGLQNDIDDELKRVHSMLGRVDIEDRPAGSA